MNLLSEERRRLLALKLRERGIDVLHLERRAGLPGALRRQLPRLSFAQQRLWVLDRLEPGNPFYNISAPAELEGHLEAATLARAFAGMARRHESLRTTFGERDGVPYQVIAPPPDPAGWPLPVIDLADLPPAAARREAERLALAEARTPMDLARGPLVRTALVRLGPTVHLLLLTLHHIVSDGWSNGILLREMAALYEAFAAGRPSPLPEPPLQYADFAEWQLEELRGERLDQEIAWWRERLAGAPAVLELPADRPRPPVQTFAGARLPLWIGAERTAALHRLAREESATLFMVLLAALGVLLRSWTGQEDLLVGTPIANRRRPELEGIIGFFANTLVLRVDLSGDPTARELAGRVREVAHDAFAHQDLPFEKLVEELQPERDLARSPLFQVLAVLQNSPPARAALRRLSLRSPDLDPGVARFDLMLDLTELEETGGGLRGAFEYSTDLFDAATIERLGERFGRILEAFTAGPGRRLSELPPLPAAEQRLVAEDWAAGPALPAPPSVLDLIAAQAGRTPDMVAVAGPGGECLTYRELRARAGGLARHLHSLGLGQGSRVALALDRSLELPIALLGTLQAGAAYVPLDPAWPAERLAFMLEDSRADLVLSREEVVSGGGSSPLGGGRLEQGGGQEGGVPNHQEGFVPGAAQESLSRSREESSRPSGAPLPGRGRVLPTFGSIAPEPGKSSPESREDLSRAREELSRLSGGLLPRQGRALPALGSTAPEPGKSPPEVWEDLARPAAEPSRSSGEPSATVSRPAVEPRRPGAPLAPPSEDSAPSEPFTSRPAAEPPMDRLPAGALEHPSLVPRPAPGGERGLPRLSSSPASRGPVAPSEPAIQVTIGRIEVKAPPQPPPPPARPSRQGPQVTLTDYLRRRREGR